MRIAMLSVHSCPLGRLGTRDTGGMSVYIRELAAELGRRGHSVDIFTRCHGEGHPDVMSLGENARLVHLRAGEDELAHKLALYVHLPDFGCALENFRKREGLKYDIIYSHYWLSAWVGKLVHGWWGIPHMTMFHTLGATKNATGIGEEETELRIETERYLVGNCDRVIAATEREKRDIVRLCGGRAETIGVVPCGVNLDLFKRVRPDLAMLRLRLNGDRTLLFVGRLDPLKGLDRLLEAMADLKEEGLRLVVVGGDGDGYEKGLRRLCRELNIEGSVDFRGLVRHGDMPGYYSAADVCVIPSYYESFGLVALESLACGTPVVSTKVGIAENVLADGRAGRLLPDNTPASLARGVSEFLAESRGGVAERRAAVAPYRWSNIADAIIQECYRLR